MNVCLAAGVRRHSSNTTSTLTVLLQTMSSARLSIQPSQTQTHPHPAQLQHHLQQHDSPEYRRVETIPTALELLHGGGTSAACTAGVQAIPTALELLQRGGMSAACTVGVETISTALELLPQASCTGAGAGHDDTSRDPLSSPRRPDLVKFTLVVDSA